ncbi:LysR substrate-binding domain-containing protein [Noviherbaspirillum sedimenti]|uniref:LysR family transcriptional regulator n=1 Tax=Noviherbaspirillum sedimenti TaxID=2320865 RepID=A0A3A3G4G9_9BURK|nr:LysR substrate-binding domain-containing protein [Noviherbaspirillum sedimenti]RJG02831.1 LysR family transcriptional regulator [Noviherbaspirillum sedimenti]
MFRKLPPISMLRAFEAAARLSGFSAAAQELFITHSAVSQQIRALEKRVGYPLFYRSGNAMLLTEAGRNLAGKVREILDALEDMFPDDPGQEDAAHILTLEVTAPIAENWLIPHLTKFKQMHPDIVLHIRTTPDLGILDDDTVDMGLRYGDGNWRGVEKIKLLDEEVFPVCSPAFLQAHPGISLHNLKQHALLRHSVISWRDWFKKAGLPPGEPANSLAFNDLTHTIQAALAGQGIALARSLLVQEHLRSQRLVRLFDISARGAFSYYLVWHRNDLKEASMALFRAWVISELPGHCNSGQSL